MLLIVEFSEVMGGVLIHWVESEALQGARTAAGACVSVTRHKPGCARDTSDNLHVAVSVGRNKTIMRLA